MALSYWREMDPQAPPPPRNPMDRWTEISFKRGAAWRKMDPQAPPPPRNPMDRWTESSFKRGAAWRKMDPSFQPVFTQFSVQRSMGF